MSSSGHARELVLVGAGHAHVEVLLDQARNPDSDSGLTLLVDRMESLYSGMLPGFIEGRYRRGELVIDVRALAERCGARFLLGRARGIDALARRIRVEGQADLSYDVASLDVGAIARGNELVGVSRYAIRTRPAYELLEGLDRVLARARAEPVRPQRLIVIGGGAAGVELAFCLGARLVREGLPPPALLLLERGPALLPAAARSLSVRAERALARRGIERWLGVSVERVEQGRVILCGGEALAFDALVWATGAAAHPWLADSALPVDARGYVLTGPTLRVLHTEGLFAAGDCARLVAAGPLPKAGVFAVRAGPVLARNLRASLRGEPLASYKPQSDFLTLLNTGDGRAIAAKWGCSLEGRWAMRLKDRIDRRFVARYVGSPPALENSARSA